MNKRLPNPFRGVLLALALALAPVQALADAVDTWNRISIATLAAGNVGGNPRARTLAIAHVAMFEAVNAIEGRYRPYGLNLGSHPGASMDAAAAAAAHAALVALVPSQKAKLDESLSATLAGVTDAAARAAGVALGEKAAAALLAERADDALGVPDTYRPHATPGVWVPTTPPITPEYARAKPWGSARHDTYRPGPPPALTSELYARDYNETRSLGGARSTARTPAQTEAVRFWTQNNLQASVDQVARQYIDARKLGTSAAARLYALLYMAYLNTFIADWDAKFLYNFWRPITAIRNGDMDGNDATEREAGWTPLNATPMHPEYPSQAAIIASILRTIIESEFGTAPLPLVISDTATPATKRSFENVARLAEEMSEVRIWGGIHFRTALKVSDDMGRRIAADLLSSSFKPVR